MAIYIVSVENPNYVISTFACRGDQLAERVLANQREFLQDYPNLCIKVWVDESESERCFECGELQRSRCVHGDDCIKALEAEHEGPECPWGVPCEGCDFYNNCMDSYTSFEPGDEQQDDKPIDTDDDCPF